ncbi:carboxylating nicotinate-nucleotide diphosphorylase [Alteromonas lipolytica]|uniref:carboxylating nicotinate-nucleotide diphosphorylase n=1 Tax=Alteromonas lipolytica TaxID=1856405 RepID=UPI000AA4D7B7|nr:carboxylating nicotinate-nucleotide diphosphorylase [Alteromonas lipolytica]GGF67034.1 nicotinate-nucleotide diphosphorylase [Alteromonas lipolytica]
MSQQSLPSQQSIKEQVIQALAEDLGGKPDASADITANLIPASQQATATIITRENCIVCGVAWAQLAFSLVDETIEQQWLVQDGDKVTANTTLVALKGPARALLTAERTALNFLQMLSGTATDTAYYASLLAHSDTRILDTRKTIPGLRLAQKYAVACGGGKNHRIGLYDAFLIKENHIMACGGIQEAISTAKTQAPGKPVEVEVENLDELQQAIEAGADIVMLDNFSNEQIQRAVSLTQKRCKLEVSGNITSERLTSLATLGVDYISSGALTKHVKAIDLSLRINL